MIPPRPGARRLAFVSAAYGFACFWTFPAIPIGASSAIDVPTLAGAALIVASLRSLRFAEIAPFVALALPVGLSAVLWFVFGGAVAPEVLPRAALAWSLALLSIVPAGVVIRTCHAAEVFEGACVAISLHAVIALYQLLAFSQGEFPFVDLMATNPSMAIPQSVAEDYAVSVARPFGLFAEPSAMAAVVGPWLILASGFLLVPSLRTRFARQRPFAIAALCAGLLLLVLSESGHAIVVIAATAAVAVTSFRRPTHGGTWARRFVVGIAFLAVVAGALVAFVLNAEARLTSENSSWEARASSLLLALDVLSSGGLGLVVGMGPGQSFARLQGLLGAYLPEGQTSITSVTLAYAIETGLLGIAALTLVAWRVARRIQASSARAIGWLCAAVWAVGVTITTSYPQQPALWLLLALLLYWPEAVGHRRAPFQGLAPSTHP